MKNFFPHVRVIFLMLFGCYQTSGQSLDSLKARYDLMEPFVSTNVLVDRSPLLLGSSGSVFNPFAHDGTDTINGDALIFENLHRILYHAAYDSSLMKFEPDDFDAIVDYALFSVDRSAFSTAQLVQAPQVNDIALGFFHLDFDALSLKD